MVASFSRRCVVMALLMFAQCGTPSSISLYLLMEKLPQNNNISFFENFENAGTIAKIASINANSAKKKGLAVALGSYSTSAVSVSSAKIYNLFVNRVMKRGKKQVSEKIVATCCMLIKMKELKDRNFLYKAISNAKPLLELKPQQKGFRKKLFKPIPIKSNRGLKLAID